MNTADEVLPSLFIGSYDDACDTEFVESNQITHIVTVASDLPPKFGNKIEYLVVNALDLDTEDLFPYFQLSFEFIEKALSGGGKVLVHCLYGISRSSTIVISYIMQKMRVKYDEAFAILKEKHERASPNGGFVRQLKKMEAVMFGTDLPFLCKNCRTELFGKADLVEHSSEKSKSFGKKKKDGGDRECKSWFLGKMDWMGECGENSGKIECPYCLGKLGDYNWAGKQCSCGKFVTPAFQIRISAVDGQVSFDGYISQPKKWT